MKNPANPESGSDKSMNYQLPAKLRIGWAQLQVLRLDPVKQFYSDYIGFRPIGQETDRVVLGVPGSDTGIFRLTENQLSSPEIQNTTGLFHTAILLPSRKHLAFIYKHLTQLDVHFDGFADHLVSEALYLTDPEGNGLEIYADRPRAEWRRSGTEIAMATNPLNIRELLMEAAQDDAWQGMPRGTVIGHIHLRVSNLSKTGSFYQNIGMDITNKTYPGAMFLSAGGYHHHIGLNIWSSGGAPSPRKDSPGLKSFSIVLPTVKEIEEFKKHLESVGIANHGGENVIIIDPDGVRIEVESDVHFE